MSFYDLRDYFRDLGYKIIIAADGEPRTHEKINGELKLGTAAGGVGTGFDSLARASGATYITRGKSQADREAMQGLDKITIQTDEGNYQLKRLFFSEDDTNDYYFGFSNQTLWPLSHAAFEQPVFRREWYEGYKRVNKAFADAIQEEISGKTFIWVNDYQLSLVPTYLGKPKDTVIGFFWHIPWPTWEIFRVLPWKRDILWSLLNCDYLAFHRRYQATNFLTTADRELEARIDHETNTIFFDENALTIGNLAMGIDTDVIADLAGPHSRDTYLTDIIRRALGIAEDTSEKKEDPMDAYFHQYQVLLGVDRLDYTKGLPHRLWAIDRFFEKYPKYIGKVIYLGIMSPSRTKIPSYQALKSQIQTIERSINKKYGTKDWQPLHLFYESYTREDVINFYKKAKLCLVTPLDDGMNLVSKEFIVAANQSSDPGMLILSQFAGSAMDLTKALIVNPYNTEEVADAIDRGLRMNKKERQEKIADMAELLEDRNIYEWAHSFVKNSVNAAKENRK